MYENEGNFYNTEFEQWWTTVDSTDLTWIEISAFQGPAAEYRWSGHSLYL